MKWLLPEPNSRARSWPENEVGERRADQAEGLVERGP